MTPTEPAHKAAATPLVRHVEHVMGMPISVALRGRHAAGERGDAAWAGALAVLREADHVFSTYRAGSAISRLDRGELTLADCPPEVAEVLALGAAARRDSDGAFDVHRNGRLDPSGVVKGWATDRAAAHLALLPGTDFCLSSGGDLICRTLAPDSRPWRIGVEDPHDPDRLIATIAVHNGAVATSSTARRGAHITDGRTGLVPTGIASVTVIGDSLTEVDIEATAAYARGSDAGSWLAARRRTALIVRTDGSTMLLKGDADEERVKPTSSTSDRSRP